MKRSWLVVVGILAMLLSLLPGSVFAQAPASAQVVVVVPVPGPDLDVTIVTVNNSPGGQTDPHLSGDWVSYTDNASYGVRFQNPDLGIASDRLIPNLDNEYDWLSNISGNTIVFSRATNLGTAYPGGPVIYSEGIDFVQIDPFGNPGLATEVSPIAGAILMRRHAAIGGDTIAYEDRTYNESSATPAEISLSSATDPAAPAYRLTDDTLDDQMPAVSPDGNAVVWLKCVYNANPSVCDVWRVERTADGWGVPEQVTGAEGSESLPDTNGPVTVYGSTAGGDNDIRWSVKDSSGAYVESVLALPGLQRGPSISGNLIVFQSNSAIGGPYDIWLYDLATNKLYQLTNNSDYEYLMDVSIGPGGLVRVAWAQPKMVYPFDMDIYAMSFTLPSSDTDTTAPTITLTTPAEGAVYLLGQTVNADYACQDEAGGSGLASCVGNVPNGSALDTSSIGAKTFTVNAADSAGNLASVTHTYHVLYNFTGFASPVDNPDVLNTAKAGQAIPLKWRITDANGNPVTTLTGVSVTAVSLSCPSAPTTDTIEEYVASNSGLQNLGDGYYQWNWKSPTSYANSCITLKLDLGEGAGFEHLALFQFRK